MQTSEGSGACQNELAFGLVFGWLDPYGIAVTMIEDHLVAITSAGDVKKLTSLIGKRRVIGVICFDVDLLTWFGGCCE